jgi:large subunit ribosomal protein L19
VARGDVRRAKLYYLRGKVGKRARVAERRWGIEDEMVVAADEAEAVDAEGVAITEAEPEVVEPPEEEGEQTPEGKQPAQAEEPAANGGETAEAESEPEPEAKAHPSPDEAEG